MRTEKIPVYIFRTSFEVILGRIQWNGAGGVIEVTTEKFVHPNFSAPTLANDIALLRLPNAVAFNSEYPSPVSLMLLGVYCGHI